MLLSCTLYHVSKSFFGDDKVFQPFPFQFFAQTGDIYGQGIVVNKAVTFPELCHNGISGDCFSGMFQKYLQNAEFVFRKVNIMTVPGQGTAGRIQDSTLMFKDISRSSEG